MKKEDAWLFVAERAQRAIETDEDQLILCDALVALGQGLKLGAQFELTERLGKAIRERHDAQTDFVEMFFGPAQAPAPAVPGTPSHPDHYHSDPS
jgi:hypothetical protein